MKKLIETVLPLQDLNRSAEGERVRKGHPGNLHLWWKRSPIYSSAALLRAALVDNTGDNQETLEKEVHELQDIADGLSFPEIKGEGLPCICDPFSGFGGLALAAEKLGLSVEASDVNPVAVLLTKAATEIPERFVGHAAIHPENEASAPRGTSGLAADILWYGHRMKEAAEQKLAGMYPSVSCPDSMESMQAYAWIWVRTMNCPNPACHCEMPLASSFVLSKTKGSECWAEPFYEGKNLHFGVYQGICPKEKETNKHSSIGAKFRCPLCGELTGDEAVKKAGQAGKLGKRLMAVCVIQDGKKRFLVPDEAQEQAAFVHLPEMLPKGSIPDNTRWFSPPEFGITEYADLYLPRQLRLLTTLCNLIPDMIRNVTNDAAQGGFSDDGVSLSNGGHGATAYGQAVGVYLALLIGKMANFASTVCTWDNRYGNIRAAFTRQAIPMTWTFAEGNPFGTANGNFDAMLESIVGAVQGLGGRCSVHVQQEDARQVSFPEQAVLFTEIPYYDYVGYADLSDYFYIWIRSALRDVYPDLFAKVVTSKDELCSIPEHFGGDAEKAIDSYESGIDQMLWNFSSKASEAYPSILFFAYSRQDDASIHGLTEEDRLTPLEHLMDSLVQNGFQVTGLWPVRTEKLEKRHDSFRIAVVFRKKSGTQNPATRRGFINALKHELPERFTFACSMGVGEEDQGVVGLGIGLSIFTKYRMVLNADGSDMRIRDALRIIYQEVKEVRSAENGEESAGEE